MFFLGLLTSAAYWPGVFSPAMTPKWVALSIVAPALLLWVQDQIHFTRAHVAGAGLLIWAALTVLWSPSPLDSLNALWLIGALPAVCFVLGAQTESLRSLFLGAALGLTISSGIAIAQSLGWDAMPAINSPSGLFLNKNFMAEAAALVVIWLVAERVWWLALPVLPALVLTDCRGALLALGVGLAIMCWRRPTWLIGGLLVADAGLFAHAMLMHGAATMVERADIWSDASDGISVFGDGIGSFGVTSHKLQIDGMPRHAHNDALELICDLGIIGGFLAVLFVRELFGPLNPARMVMIVFAVEACFAYPLHLPTTLCLVAVAAGHAVGYRALVWNVARSGRNFGLSGMAGTRSRHRVGDTQLGRADHAA